MLEDISGEQIKEQFKSNSTLRMVTMVVGGLIVLVIGYFLYQQFIAKPANEKSKDATWSALNLIQKDSTDMAIEELKLQVNKFDGKVGGEVSQFLLAGELMKKGEFEKAIEALDGTNLDDTYGPAMVLGLKGDAYSELANYSEAINNYMEAAEVNPNDLTSPMYLMKAGLCLEELNNFEKATETYTKIKNNYPLFASQKQIDKYIARTGNKKN